MPTLVQKAEASTGACTVVQVTQVWRVLKKGHLKM